MRTCTNSPFLNIGWSLQSFFVVQQISCKLFATFVIDFRVGLWSQYQKLDINFSSDFENASTTLKLTNRTWNTGVGSDEFPKMGPAIFSGAFAVSFRGRVSISRWRAATNGRGFYSGESSGKAAGGTWKPWRDGWFRKRLSSTPSKHKRKEFLQTWWNPFIKISEMNMQQKTPSSLISCWDTWNHCSWYSCKIIYCKFMVIFVTSYMTLPFRPQQKTHSQPGNGHPWIRCWGFPSRLYVKKNVKTHRCKS